MSLEYFLLKILFIYLGICILSTPARELKAANNKDSVHNNILND